MKKVSEQSMLRWKEFCQQLKSNTDVLIESSAEKAERIALLLKDYKLFFEYYFHEHATAPTAPFHEDIAKAILKNKQIRAIVEAFRGSAKSTHCCIGIPFWLMMRGELKYMVLVGQNEEKACKLIGDIQAHLENNSRIIYDFGEQMSLGDWADGEFTTKNGVTFTALGLGQSPRGLRKGANRPDYIVLDDADSKRLSKNPKLVKEAREWVLRDLLGCFDVGNQRFVLCNNRISKTSILTLLAEEWQGSANFYHKIVNALTPHGESAWASKYTAEYWQEKQKESYRAFQAEYMNNPIEEGTVFQADWFRYEKMLSLKQYQALVCYCDPSFKDKNTNDYKAIVLLGMKDTEVHLLDCFVRQSTISDMVRYMYDCYEATKNDASVDFYMEANFVQDMLVRYFHEEGEKRGYQLRLRKDTRKKPDKFQRIENLSPLFESGKVVFNEKRRYSADFKKLEEQFLCFEKGSRTADDAPDAFEGGVFYLERKKKSGSANIMLTGERSRRRF